MGQKGARLSDPGGAISVGEQAVVADFDEARRQDVQAEAAEELLQRERHRSDLTVVGIVLVAEGDGAVLQIQSLHSAVGDGHPVGVAAQIGQDRLRTGKGPFGVDDPFGATELDAASGQRPPGRRGAVANWETAVGPRRRVAEPVAELGAEDHRQRARPGTTTSDAADTQLCPSKDKPPPVTTQWR